MKISTVFALTGLLVSGGGLAQEARGGDIVVRDAWVRATVAGQRATGLFMRIESASGATLVDASVPARVAGASEIHESIRDKEMARMRRVERVDIAAGKATEFKPGGYHVMLLDAKQAFTPGETVPVTLKFKQGGKTRQIELAAPVRPLDHAAVDHSAMHGAMHGSGK